MPILIPADSPAANDCRTTARGELRLGVAAARGDLRWAAVDLTGPLEEIRRQVDLSPLSAVALGRALSAAALILRFSVKEAGHVLVEVRGDGPMGKVTAEADSRGLVRGMVGEPRFPTPADGWLRLAPAIGKGLFKVTRTSTGGRHESQVALNSGEIGDDLVHFLEQSQQIRSAALLGVLPKPDGIAEAGGLLIEAFPGVAEATLLHLENNITRLSADGGVSAVLERGGLPGLLDAALDGFEREELERHELTYGCGRGRDTLADRLQTLSREDIDEIVDAEDNFAADCAFCGRRYTFSRQELMPIN